MDYINIITFIILSYSTFINIFRFNKIIYNIGLILFILLWFATKKKYYLNVVKINKVIINKFFFIVIIYLFLLVSKNINLFKYYFDVLEIIFFMYAFEYYKKYNDKYLKIINILIIFGLVVSSLLTIRYQLENPFAARSFKYNLDEDTIELAAQGVGTYTLIYPIMFLIFVSRVINNKILKNAISLIFFICVIISGYSYAILLLFIGIIIYIILINIKKRRFIFLFIFTSILMISVINYQLIIDYLINIKLLSNQKAKLEALKSIINYGRISGYVQFEARYERYARSILQFIKYPIFGSSIFGNSIYGLHSTVLDSFALNGIWGGIGILIILYSGYSVNKIREKNKNNIYIIQIIIYILYFILGLINLITPSVVIAIWFIFPSMIIIENKRIKKKEQID